MSLYLKYRPQGFSSLVGQDHIKTTLQNSLKLAKVSHAYLFCGSRGTGKTSTARILAKSLDCLNFDEKNLEPCQQCEMCLAINEGRLIDMIEIDAASNRGIDEIRELRETIKFSPTQARNKIYIIDEVHMLTKEAFNALLKTLEEPPANVYFILATTEIHKIPETIISRCQRFDFKRFSEKDLVKQLKFIASEEKIKFEDEALFLVSKAVNGGMRDAISVFEQLAANGKITVDSAQALLGSVSGEILSEFVKALLEQENQKALELVSQVHRDAVDLDQFKKDLLQKLRSFLLEAIAKSDLKKQKHLTWIIETLQKLIIDFKGCPIPQLSLELLIAKQASYGTAVLEFKSTNSKPADSVVQTVPTIVKAKKHPKENLASSLAKTKNEDMYQAQPETNLLTTDKNLQENISKQKINQSEENDPLQKTSKDNAKLDKTQTTPEIIQESHPIDINLKSLQNEWQNIVSKVSKTAIKILLQQTKILALEGNIITVGVSSSFYLDKLNKAETKGIIEAAILESTNNKLVIKFDKVAVSKIVVAKAPLKSIPVQNAQQPVAPAIVDTPSEKSMAAQAMVSKTSPEELNKKTIVDEALAMFGDEIQHE